MSGNPTRHLGYFDAPPHKPAIIEFEERLLAKNDTIKVTPVVLPFVYLKHETMPEYPALGLKIHGMEVEGPFLKPGRRRAIAAYSARSIPNKGPSRMPRSCLKELLPKAFRRPVTAGEERPFVALVETSLAAGGIV